MTPVVRVVVGSSTHPVTAEATGEVLGALLAVGGAPDLVVLGLRADHAAFAEEVERSTRAVLDPASLALHPLPAVDGVDGHPAPGLTAWASWGPALALCSPTGDPAHGTTGDPARGAAGDRILLPLGDDVAVGIDPRCALGPRIATPVRPIGDPMAVTGVDGAVVTGLAGSPAAVRIDAALAGMDRAERADAAAHGLWFVVGEGARAPESDGDPGLEGPVVGIRGMDRIAGVVAVDAAVALGATVQVAVLSADRAIAAAERVLGASGPVDAYAVADRGPVRLGAALASATSVPVLVIPPPPAHATGPGSLVVGLRSAPIGPSRAAG